MYKRVLIYTDGKPHSERVIDFFCAIQKVQNATINVVYVIEVPRSLPINAHLPKEMELAKRAMEATEEIAARHEISVNISVIYARSMEYSVISTAEELKCDVIAIAQDNEKLRIFRNAASNIYEKAKCSVWLFNDRE